MADLSPLHVTFVTTASDRALAWTRGVRDYLGPVEPGVAFQALRGVLHALHLCLPAPTSRALSAALPTLLRGVYHEPPAPRARADSRDAFLATVNRTTRHSVRPEEAVRAVLFVAEATLPLGVWCELRASLPGEIESLLAIPPYSAPGAAAALRRVR